MQHERTLEKAYKKDVEVRQTVRIFSIKRDCCFLELGFRSRDSLFVIERPRKDSFVGPGAVSRRIQ